VLLQFFFWNIIITSNQWLPRADGTNGSFFQHFIKE